MGVLGSFQKTIQSPKQISLFKVCLEKQALNIYVKKLKSNFQYIKCFGKFNYQNLLSTCFEGDRNNYNSQLESKLMMIGSFRQKDFSQEFNEYFKNLNDLFQQLKSSSSSRITINYSNSEIILTKQLYDDQKDKKKYKLKSFYIKMDIIFIQFPKSSNETIDFITKIIQQKCIFVYGARYLPERWDIFFSCVRSINLQKLSFNEMHLTDVFQIISPINFRNLKMLWLNSNSIKNVQGLQFIDMNNLERLWLDSNLINSLKCFKKLNFKKLIVLALNSNVINSFQPITRCNIFTFIRETQNNFQKKENYQRVSIESNRISYKSQASNISLSKQSIFMLQVYEWDHVVSYDINFLHKIKSFQLKQLWCQKQKRINIAFQKQYKMLMQKFKDLKTFSHTQHISAIQFNE